MCRTASLQLRYAAYISAAEMTDFVSDKRGRGLTLLTSSHL